MGRFARYGVQRERSGPVSAYYEINANILPQVRLVDKAVLEPPYVHRRRKTDEYILYIMKKGTLYLKENGQDYELREGDVILLDPDFTHQGNKASNCEYFYVHFRHSQIRRRREDAAFWPRCLKVRSESLQEDNGSWRRYQDCWLKFPKVTHLKTGPRYLKVAALLENAMERNCDQMENYKVSCACRIMEAMVEIAREAVSQNTLPQVTGMPGSYRKVHELLNYLNVHYREPISSRTIEEAFACNFDHLNRVFKKNVGKTIFVYLNELRIYHARELIATASMKMAAVAYRVGFEDESYFSKVFKKYTGVSPAYYEKYMVQGETGQKKPG